ncbi:c-type cytochrome biogenesis protein CcsB [Glutamicibacter ardleyensis]|uniref:c-type cytochrome biogenesis protein CcsB n=1 Tax=Glutamicibacter ardleyensis TaxID=225894 RepID=UPI003FD063C0
MVSINTQLAEISELLMLAGSLTYLVAFIVFAWDLGSLSKQKLEQRDREAVLATGSTSGAGLPPSPDVWGYTKQSSKIPRVAVSLTVLGFLIHAFAVTSRGIAANRVPWGNLYEYFTTGALIVVGVYLVLLMKKDLRFLGTFLVGIALLMMCAATIGFPTPVAHLMPALQSYWLIIHVSVAVIASALFTVSFALSVLQLIKSSKKVSSPEVGASWRWLSKIPAAEEMENLAYRLITVAFVCWTFTLIAGAVWAEQAWGRYWGWDPKEVWTFVIWAVYAGYLHARATAGWKGNRSAYLSIIGFACIIINSTLINIFADGLHSYAGI